MNIKNKKQITLITILLLSFFITKNSFSDEENSTKSGPTRSQSFHISLGGGVAIKNNIRKNNNKEHFGGDVIASPIPLMQISWGPFFVGQQGLTFNLFGNREFSGYINLNRAGDDYYATGMAPRYSSWFFGGGLKYKKFHFNISRDIQGRSKGIRTTMSYTELYPLSEKFFTTASITLECTNKKYANYYYGVENNEVTSDRSEYHPRAYCLPGVVVLPGYKIDEHLSLMSGLALKVITKEVRNSPTVKDTWLETALIIGALWKF